ncbi:L,D-transpeptidase family protein [Alphaproteobacteria bacterium]|nr:L,D-transpeptidase family protein [Alphaproteobacteria bacterium]
MQKNWLVIKLNKKYFLKVGYKFFRCQIGKAGFKNAAKKIEGDNTTPIGKWCIESIYYRADRAFIPKFKKNNVLKTNRITKHCAWCDDITSLYYNKHININNFSSLNINYEKLWREDNAYDIIIVTSHNVKPTIKNKGSAIFLHCSFSDDRNTAGCIALKKKDLIFLLKKLKDKTYIKIKK